MKNTAKQKVKSIWPKMLEGMCSNLEELQLLEVLKASPSPSQELQPLPLVKCKIELT